MMISRALAAAKLSRAPVARTISSRGGTTAAASAAMAGILAWSSLGGALFFHSLVTGSNDPSRARISACESPSHEPMESSLTEEAERFDQCLAYHRSLLTTYRSRWDWGNPQARIPTASWPTNVPPADEIGPMMSDLPYCKRSPNFRSDKDYCDRLRFKVASFLLMQSDADTQKRGLKIIRDLAERGHPDSMCFYAMCLNDGRASLDPNPQQGVVWWRLCADMHQHPHCMYELGVALYTGEGCVEDEAQAVRLWRSAADSGHAGAAYMLGDCLLDGVGVQRDRAEALEWLITAAELGHRGARSRVLAVLEKEDGIDYGKFTDASRQTLKEHVPEKSEIVQNRVSDNKRDVQEKSFLRKPSVERRFTIGGGSRNPVVLARRKTIVQESRGNPSQIS